MGIAPGWYQDPADPTIQRWWDGEGWIGAPVPAGTPPPAEPRVTLDAAEVPPSVPTPPPRQVPPGWSYNPRARPGTPAKPHGYPLATLGARVVARIVDIIAVFLLNAAVNGWFVVQYVQEIWPMLSEAWRRSLAGDASMDDLPQPGEQAGTLQLVILLLATALWFAYEVPAVANSGQTLGKRLLRIKVVRLDGPQPLGFGRSIRRWNPMGIGFLAWSCFCLGVALNLVDFVYALYDRPLQQTLHDKYAQTVVVALVPESANPPRTARSARPPQPPPRVPESVPSEEEQSDEPADPRRS